MDLSSYFAEKAVEDTTPEVADKGIMKRSPSKAAATETTQEAYDPYSFMPKFAEALKVSFGDPEQGKRFIGSMADQQSEDVRMREVESYMSDLTRRNAIEDVLIGLMPNEPQSFPSAGTLGEPEGTETLPGTPAVSTSPLGPQMATPALNLDAPIDIAPVDPTIMDYATESDLSSIEELVDSLMLESSDDKKASAETPEEREKYRGKGKGLMSKKFDEKGSTDYYNPKVISEQGSKGVKEAQKRLKDLGLYLSSVDGAAGRGTSNAIKTFQYNNGLEVTGTLDKETRIKLSMKDTPETKLAKDSPNPLLALIAKGEGGGYSAANDFNSAKGKAAWGVRNGYFSDRKGKPLDKLTISEIQELQRGGWGNREVFAVGAYQIIPDTMNEIVSQMGLTGDEVFSPELQDQIAIEYLIPKKRKTLGAYLQGKEGMTSDAAMMDLAKEWASVPVPYKTKDPKGRTVNKGDSFYKHYGGQNAAHSVEETRKVLEEMRLRRMKSRG